MIFYKHLRLHLFTFYTNEDNKKSIQNDEFGWLDRREKILSYILKSLTYVLRSLGIKYKDCAPLLPVIRLKWKNWTFVCNKCPSTVFEFPERPVKPPRTHRPLQREAIRLQHVRVLDRQVANVRKLFLRHWCWVSCHYCETNLVRITLGIRVNPTKKLPHFLTRVLVYYVTSGNRYEKETPVRLVSKVSPPKGALMTPHLMMARNKLTCVLGIPSLFIWDKAMSLSIIDGSPYLTCNYLASLKSCPKINTDLFRQTVNDE